MTQTIITITTDKPVSTEWLDVLRGLFGMDAVRVDVMRTDQEPGAVGDQLTAFQERA